MAHRAARLRSELRKISFRDATRIDATFGVASFPDDGETAAELLRAADRALYLARKAGKEHALGQPADVA